MAQKKRFAPDSEEIIEQKRQLIVPSNTRKANEKAARLFRSYLTEIGEDTKFEDFDCQQLDRHLKQFYFRARKEDGQHYKSTSLENFRHSLNRYLNLHGSQKVDIIKDAKFANSNEYFKAALKELKTKGLGNVAHHPVILQSDLEKIYVCLKETDSARALLNKVQFDIRLYFFRRGSENIHAMTKTTFTVKTDPGSKCRYIVQTCDELNKNHNENDKESYSGFMPEMKGDPRCPVNSFLKLLEHLHPLCSSLWQRPLDDHAVADKVVLSELWTIFFNFAPFKYHLEQLLPFLLLCTCT